MTRETGKTENALSRRTLLSAAAGFSILANSPACAALALTPYSVVAEGLAAPEGPRALSDGTFLVGEMARGVISRIRNGKIEDIANLGGSPNGIGVGPDGAAYVCNNGGLNFARVGDTWQPAGTSPNRVPGTIQRVDLKTGAFKTLYAKAGDNLLSAPNDIVFDSTGGFWFTDAGATVGRKRDLGGVYWAKPDGSEIREVVFGLLGPNGIVLSPDGKTLYVALTQARQVLTYRVEAPGKLATGADGRPTMTVLESIAGLSSFDSMSMEADGTLVAASPQESLIKVYRPDGTQIDERALGVPGLTNVTFGGADMKTLYISLTRAGKLVSIPWPRPGLKLANQ